MQGYELRLRSPGAGKGSLVCRLNEATSGHKATLTTVYASQNENTYYLLRQRIFPTEKHTSTIDRCVLWTSLTSRNSGSETHK